ncbi:MAG: pyrophosphate--fructose 6-phosphate 1-phosphotransferase [Candidatus Poribacteria bacterium]|nr:MAG: pyrophosphate--fructose 6-phosphate 1-phosphotransferase [Candidatus Poribacteria bacterium]
MSVKGKIGVLTGGGDTTALNATLKGVALAAEEAGYEVIGICEGWAGMLEGGQAVRLPAAAIDENRGGTIIKSSRTNLRRIEGGIEQASRRIHQLKLDALIAIGGDDTLTVGVELAEYHRGVPINFVTKTIDNDVGTNPPPGDPPDFEAMKNYFCPGFPTAAQWLFTAADALRTTAYSHDRILILEAMGRTAGWLALATCYGHPDFIILPESPLDVDAFAKQVAERYLERKHAIIVIAEGAVDPEGNIIGESDAVVDSFGHKRLGGVSEWLEGELQQRLAQKERIISASAIRAVIPSYLQRCGSPIPVDRDTAMAAGRAIVAATLEGKSGYVGCPVRRGDRVEAEALPVDAVLPRDASGTVIPRLVDRRLYDPERYAPTPWAAEYFKPIFGPIAPAFRYPDLEPYSGE